VLTALRDERNHVRGFAKVLRDRTEQKHLEEALRQRAEELAEEGRRKDEFLAVLAHELRNPLAPIANAMHVIRLGSQDAYLVEQMRGIAERQVGYMTRLVDDLLDLSRISQGLIQLIMEPLDIAQPLQQAVEGVQHFIRDRNIALTVSLPPQPLHVEADPTRLQQIIGNLLSNAAKYTDPGGTIVVTVRPEDGAVVLRVRDSGIGISAEMLPHVFDMFMQAERRLDRSHGGLGIGLTLVQRLVAMHGGTVTASSEGRGKGSEFVMRLPALPETRKQLLRERAADSTAHPFIPRHIVVVDDNMDAAESLASLLRLEGHLVRTAYDGSSGLAAVDADPPDVVILDLGMPGMDGFEVARRIRQRPEFSRVLLVALTGWAQDEDRRRCQHAGFDGHLPKPVEREVLRQFLTHPQLELDGQKGDDR
jgi:two-component system CheB/CheR fusion protein